MLTQQGHQVVLLYMNNGAWPPTSADIRSAEAKRACNLLKARSAYADQENGNSIVDKTHYERFASILQSEAPDAVFTHWPIDNHRDHRAAAMLTYDAWQNLKRSFALYYFEVSDGEDTMQFTPDRYCDISDYETVKKPHAMRMPARVLTATTLFKTAWLSFGAKKLALHAQKRFSTREKIPSIYSIRIREFKEHAKATVFPNTSERHSHGRPFAKCFAVKRVPLTRRRDTRMSHP